MTSLPPIGDLDGSTPGHNQGIFKTAIGSLRTFIADLFGSDSGDLKAVHSALKLAEPGALRNFSLAFSSNGTALTLAVKDAGGSSDPSAASPVLIGQRSATATSGSANLYSVSSALSLVISSGATLGQPNGSSAYLYAYLISNGSAQELAVSASDFGASGIVSTTLMSGSATSASVMYSAAARANVPFRKVSRFRAPQTTAGTWAATPTSVDLWPWADALPSASLPVRQTVINGPVDSSGLASFGGSTGSTTVTMAGTLVAAAANGAGALGAIDLVGVGSNLSWTGLSTNGTMYLYVDVAAGGLTPGSGTLAPVYQWGGTYSVSSGQFTFNIQEMVGKVGNGSAAVQTYRVYVGEVTVAGGVVTAITWYQLQGRYDSGFTNTLPAVSTKTSKNHNIGVIPNVADFIAECLTAEGGFAIGDQISIFGLATSDGSSRPMPMGRTRLTMFFGTGNTAAFFGIAASGTGTFFTLTGANWKWKMIARRDW